MLLSNITAEINLRSQEKLTVATEMQQHSDNFLCYMLFGFISFKISPIVWEGRRVVVQENNIERTFSFKQFVTQHRRTNFSAISTITSHDLLILRQLPRNIRWESENVTTGFVPVHEDQL